MADPKLLDRLERVVNDLRAENATLKAEVAEWEAQFKLFEPVIRKEVERLQAEEARRIHALNLRAIANAALELQYAPPVKPHERRE